MDYVLVGPLRVLFLFAGVLFFHQIITRQPLRNYGLDYILKRITFYGSSLLILVFILVQLDLYDTFSVLAIVVIILISQYFGLKNYAFTGKSFRRKKVKFLLKFFKFIEERPRFGDIYTSLKRLYVPQHISLKLITAFLVAAVCFVSRYLFLESDLYTLSDLWQTNLEFVKQFNYNQWFTSGFRLLGEDAVINLYSKVTGISEEMAVHSFGLLEVFGLSIVLYWIISKISKSDFLAPMFSVLFYGFVFKYLPINTNLLLEHNPINMAFWIALPIMIYTLLPGLLTIKAKKFMTQLMVAYSALFFVNLFVAIIVIPLFLLTALMFQTKKRRMFVLRSIWVYILAGTLVIGLHGIACYVNDVSFYSFFKENLILVDAYTYFPQIEMGIEKLMSYYAIFGVIVLLCLLPIYLKEKAKWTPALIIIIFFNIIVSLKWLRWDWIDVDLYYQTIAALIAMPIGIFFGVVMHYLKMTIPKNQLLRAPVYSFLFLMLVYMAYTSNSFLKSDENQKDKLKSDVLLVYNKLSNDYLPYSYMVVNDNYGFTISKSKHHFIQYENFLKTYIERDSIYHNIKENDKLLRENSQYILPNSVFIFVSENEDKENLSSLATSAEIKSNILRTLKVLRSRGRKIDIFYTNQYLTVYEIVNQKNSSRLDELIFNL